MTQHDTICRALRYRGFEHVPTAQTKRYTVFRSSRGFIFVGKMGAVRIGNTVTSSVPASDLTKQRLLELGAESETVTQTLERWNREYK